MIVLDSTTKKLEVVLDAAHTTNALRCASSWRDITTTTYTPGSTLVDTNGSTDVTLVAAPAASTQRVVDEISIFNDDTATKRVTVKFDVSAVETKLIEVRLGVDERLCYANGEWKVYDRAGAVRQAVDSTRILSGSTDGRGIKVTGTTTAATVTVHTASADTNDPDLVTLYAMNIGTAGVLLTIEWGNASTDDNIIVPIPAQEGLIPVVVDHPLRNGLIAKAFAATANVVILHGTVRRGGAQ